MVPVTRPSCMRANDWCYKSSINRSSHRDRMEMRVCSFWHYSSKTIKSSSLPLLANTTICLKCRGSPQDDATLSNVLSNMIRPLVWVDHTRLLESFLTYPHTAYLINYCFDSQETIPRGAQSSTCLTKRSCVLVRMVFILVVLPFLRTSVLVMEAVKQIFNMVCRQNWWNLSKRWVWQPYIYNSESDKRVVSTTAL